MQTTALMIFVITYTGIIFTRLPGINIDRPSAAFFGAVAMILSGVLSFDEAVMAIDFSTIALLLGMMLIIATLQLNGFFSLIAARTVSWAGNQQRLLLAVTFSTGIGSAFLVNDAVVLLFTPIIIMICRQARLNPIPYLIAEILAANAGSLMAITGNPQNMLIGVNAGISYGRFLLYLSPIAMMSMGMIVWLVRLLYPAEFRQRKPLVIDMPGEPAGGDDMTEGRIIPVKSKSLKRSLPVFVLVLVLFFVGHGWGLDIPMIALLGGSLMLLLGNTRPSRVIEKVDWVLLLFFASLFIVVGGIEKAGLLSRFVDASLLSADMQGVGVIHGLSLIMTQIVSNVPFAIVMLPFMKAADSEILWLSLASASTLAGNATIIGAIANLIVIESADRLGVRISFMQFLKPGLIVTLISFLISLGVFFLYLQF